MALPPAGKPWVDGDGMSAPYVLRWNLPPATTGRVLGYAVEVRVYGAGAKGTFQTLTANSGSKAQRYGLANFSMEAGSAYAFRVATLSAAAGGAAAQRGDFGEVRATDPHPWQTHVHVLTRLRSGCGAAFRAPRVPAHSGGRRGPGRAANGAVAASEGGAQRQRA